MEIGKYLLKEENEKLKDKNYLNIKEPVSVENTLIGDNDNLTTRKYQQKGAELVLYLASDREYGYRRENKSTAFFEKTIKEFHFIEFGEYYSDVKTQTLEKVKNRTEANKLFEETNK